MPAKELVRVECYANLLPLGTTMIVNDKMIHTTPKHQTIHVPSWSRQTWIWNQNRVLPKLHNLSLVLVHTQKQNPHKQNNNMAPILQQMMSATSRIMSRTEQYMYN